MSLHVVPLNDEIEHEPGFNCWCDPDVEWIDPDTDLPYANGPMVIHFAHDGREIVEQLTGEAMEPGKGWATIEE